MENKKLFIVEFGDPDISQSWRSGSQSPIFVVATDYNQAANKAIAYIESKQKNKHDIIGPDGSLDLPKEREEIKIKAVKIAGDEIIW
jgi:hypothetical protein